MHACFPGGISNVLEYVTSDYASCRKIGHAPVFLPGRDYVADGVDVWAAVAKGYDL